MQQRLGGIDILVNVPGGSSASGGGFAALDDAQLSKALNQNLMPAEAPVTDIAARAKLSALHAERRQAENATVDALKQLEASRERAKRMQNVNALVALLGNTADALKKVLVLLGPDAPANLDDTEPADLTAKMTDPKLLAEMNEADAFKRYTNSYQMLEASDEGEYSSLEQSGTPRSVLPPSPSIYMRIPP